MLRCQTSLLSVIIDFFGSSVQFFDLTDNQFSVRLHIVPSGAKLFIRPYFDALEPASLREELARELREAVARLDES